MIRYMQLLTPEEFVIAGDHLVAAVGSWQWCVAKLVNVLVGQEDFIFAMVCSDSGFSSGKK
jgi:hypothetical protein